MPSPSSSMDVFAGFDGGAAAGAVLIYTEEITLECFSFIHSKEE